jgi:hypothetical protein
MQFVQEKQHATSQPSPPHDGMEGCRTGRLPGQAQGPREAHNGGPTRRPLYNSGEGGPCREVLAWVKMFCRSEDTSWQLLRRKLHDCTHPGIRDILMTLWFRHACTRT